MMVVVVSGDVNDVGCAGKRVAAAAAVTEQLLCHYRCLSGAMR